MIGSLQLVEASVNTAAILTSGALVVMLWHRRHKPAATPLLWMSIAIFAGAVAHILALGAPALLPSGLIRGATYKFVQAPWIVVQNSRNALVAGCWLVFIVQYTGQSERLSLVIKRAMVVVVPTVLVLWSAVPFAPVYAVNWGALSINAPSLLIAIIIQLVLEGTLLVGALLVLTTALRQAALSLGQASLFSAGVITLFFTRALGNSFSDGQFLVPTGISIASVCFAVSLARYRVFETLPVATVVGRDRVIEEISEGVLILNRDERIHDFNLRAKRLLDLDTETAETRTLSEVQPAIPGPRRLANVEDRTKVRLPDGPLLSVAATEVTDHRGWSLGYLLIIRDLTKQHNREQRLALLNQLLVDVAYDRMEMIGQQVDQLIDDGNGHENPDAVGDQVWNATTELTTLVARTRKIEQALAAKTDRLNPERTDVATSVRNVLDDWTNEETSLVTQLPVDELYATVDEILVETALRTLLEDAFEDLTEAVAIQVVESDPSQITIRVDARYPSVISDSSEVVDELSLQIVQLAVNCAGGKVETSTTQRATTVRIRLPTDSRDLSTGYEPAGTAKGIKQ
jgi:PAS domain-containing protein